MSDVYDPPKRIQDGSHCASMSEYKAMYEESIRDPPAFWTKIAKQFHFEKFPSRENFWKYNFNLEDGPIKIEWMADAKTNICYNALDKHLDSIGSQVAFYWEGNDPNDSGKITYKELHLEVCKFANVLKSKGVKKGDRVAIYMPMITELVVAMLACARIGAVHSIIFGGYSAESLASRIIDAGAKLLVTADGVWRGKKLIHLLEVAENAIQLCAEKGVKVETNITVQHLPRLHSGGSEAEKDAYEKCLEACWKKNRDVWWHEVMESASEECPVEWMGAEEPLFMLYTSGSTGKPKGVLHTVGGYMLYSATTFRYSFDYRNGDIYWCTADIGWITGHSYVTYGPLLNGATSVLFEGTPFHPTNDRFWEVIEKYKVTKFYTAPTAIRALMKFGEDFVKRHDLSSLKVLGTVGEPINPEAWLWYHKYVGSEQCSIVDTYWQTETGGHVMTPLPGCTPTKPGSACFPFFGVVPVILDDEKGVELEGECEGYIAFKQPWPGIMRTVYGNHQRFEDTYFKKFPGYYMTGDGAKRDSDGYIWITGRIDDMLNCSGHLMSTAQVESALVKHPRVAEAAVVAKPHKIKGECLYCFITPKDGFHIDKQVERELKNLVREEIAPFAQPDYIQEAPNLPKTRSGKIMRRILRKIAQSDPDVGDTSTMADESVVKILQQKRDEMMQVLGNA